MSLGEGKGGQSESKKTSSQLNCTYYIMQADLSGITEVPHHQISYLGLRLLFSQLSDTWMSLQAGGFLEWEGAMGWMQEGEHLIDLHSQSQGFKGVGRKRPSQKDLLTVG